MDKMIYAIVSEKNHDRLDSFILGMKGVACRDLYAVSFEETSVVVSDFKRSDLMTDRDNIIDFASVIEKLAQQFTLLPMRFGSLMDSIDSITKMLGRNYAEFQESLQKVENKCEFGLKIFCESEKIKADLKAKSEAEPHTLSKNEPEIKYSVYMEYINRKLKEHRLEEMLLAYTDLVISTITGRMTQLDAVIKFKKMTTIMNIIDAVFLLDKGRKDELIHVIADLQIYYPILNFVLTGPWPPYSFVEIILK